MSRPLQLEYLTSAIHHDRLPVTRAEVAFIGRSNVGKSSLLNAIAGEKKLARVSNTPGRTQTLDCFRVDGGGTTLVDCPGYGYAKVAKATRAKWLPMLELYMRERENLRQIVLLVDGEIGPTASDVFMIEWLRESDLPHTVVATKHDKVKPSQRRNRQKDLAARCQRPETEIVTVSAAEGLGISELRAMVREWLA